MHPSAARSTCPSQQRKCPSRPPLLEVATWKIVSRLWRETHFEVTHSKKKLGFEPVLDVKMSKICSLLRRGSDFDMKSTKLYPRFEPVFNIPNAFRVTSAGNPAPPKQ